MITKCLLSTLPCLTGGWPGIQRLMQNIKCASNWLRGTLIQRTTAVNNVLCLVCAIHTYQLLEKYHRFETMPHKFVQQCASLCIAFLCSLFSWCLQAFISMASGQLPTDSFLESPVDREPALTRYVMFLTLVPSHSQYSRSPCYCLYQGLRCAAFNLLFLFATKCHLHLSLR